MSAGPDRGALATRAVLAAVAAADLASLCAFIGHEAVAPGASAFTLFVVATPVRVSIALVGMLAAFWFARAAGRAGAAACALTALAVLSGAHARLYGSPWRHLFFSGVCLLGWLLGLLYARARGRAGDEAYARTGAVALLGAAYFNAGLSKLVYGGFAWASGTTIETVVVGHDGLVGDGLASLLRCRVVEMPAIVAALSVATIVFELAGPLMLAGRRARRTIALGLIAMHTGILVLADILYWESFVLLLLFGVGGRLPHEQAPSDVAEADRTGTRRFAVAAALLASCGLFAIARQAALERGPSVAAHTEAPLSEQQPEIQRIGPFAVGATFAGRRVERVAVESEDSFTVELGEQEQRISFLFTCRSSPYTSPFDIGTAHIFYSTRLDPATIEATGKALREVAAGDTTDPAAVCARWRRWVSSAPTSAPATSSRGTLSQP